MIHITQEGNAAAELAMRQHFDAWDHLLTEFGQNNMEELLALMNRLFAIIEEFPS